MNEAIVDEKYRPYQDIRITHTVILEDPFDDPRGFQIPSRSPSPTPERLKNGRIGADEDINDTEGKTEEEIQEMLQEREAKARATILEIVGDLPDADIAPPENVLFVCKLNPVTTDDDLEIIFSRFGKVKSCEVIRDKYTGDSLQYAFVEFEDKKACENAYFKMDNVLIDDRRIHVDFSQSVAKVKWRGKGRGVVHQDSSGKIDFNNLRGDKKSNRRSPHSRDRRRSRSFEQRNYRNKDPRYHRDKNIEYRDYNRYKREDRERNWNNNRGREGIRDNRDRYNRRDADRRDINRDRYNRRDDYVRRGRSRSTERRPRNIDDSNNYKERRKYDEVIEKKRRKKEQKRSRSKDHKKIKKRNQRSSTSSDSSSSSSDSEAQKKKKKKHKKRKRHSSTSSSTSSGSD